MLEIGRAKVPITVPFGFHNRFFSRVDLKISNALKKHNENVSLPPLHINLALKNSIINHLDAYRQTFQPNLWRNRNESAKFWSRIYSKPIISLLSTATTTITTTKKSCKFF